MALNRAELTRLKDMIESRVSQLLLFKLYVECDGCGGEDGPLVLAAHEGDPAPLPLALLVLVLLVLVLVLVSRHCFCVCFCLCCCSGSSSGSGFGFGSGCHAPPSPVS